MLNHRLLGPQSYNCERAISPCWSYLSTAVRGEEISQGRGSWCMTQKPGVRTQAVNDCVSRTRAVGSLTILMAAGCSEASRPKAASEGPGVGPAGVLPCLELPTYAAACALVSSRYSCLVAGPHRRHIALSPRYLNRKRTGIREQLDAELLRYSERYQCL